MYENYKDLHPIDTARFSTEAIIYNTNPWVPNVPNEGLYSVVFFGKNLVPVWHTNWRDETLSWHLTCSIHASLNPSPIVRIKGPEAKKFLMENMVNNIEKWEIGTQKHGIMCLDNGLLATHGVILRLGEDEYECWWHSPYINYAFTLKKYNAELTDITGKVALFQLHGPNVRKTLEAASGEDLSDIEYLHFRDGQIDGHKVRFLRFGMAGTLGFEVHAPAEFASKIYMKILEAGKPHGIRRIGMVAYRMNHAEGGYPNAVHSFLSAGILDKGMQEFVNKVSADSGFQTPMELIGSAGQDINKRIFNPFEIGLGRCINWNHEFRGKEALLKYKENKKRDIATLEWNTEDLVNIYASQFRRGEEYCEQLEFPGVDTILDGRTVLRNDLILNAEGKEIGISMARTQSEYYRVMISLASLDLEYHEIGTEVYVLHGSPGSKQVKIRAKVAPFPYNTESELNKYEQKKLK